jgi:hypothetical protein
MSIIVRDEGERPHGEYKEHGGENWQQSPRDGTPAWKKESEKSSGMFLHAQFQTS